MPIYKLAATSQDGNVEYYLEGKEQADWGKFCEGLLDRAVDLCTHDYSSFPVDGGSLIDGLLTILINLPHNYKLIEAPKVNTFSLSNWLYGAFDNYDRPKCIPESVYQKIVEHNKRVMSDGHDNADQSLDSPGTV